MESWNVYSQNTSTPSSAWLCPNNSGSDWLHPQNNNNTERERNENNAALATPTRFIMDYNDINQNSSSSFCNPYAQEMERLFENSFLKLGSPEDVLNNNLSSWLNSNDSVVPVTTAASIADPVSATTYTNSPTPSLITDDDQDHLYNKLQERRTSTYIDDDQYPMTTSAQILNTMPSSTDANLDNRQIVVTSSSSARSTSSSPISPKKSHDHIQREQQQQKVHYPTATSSSFYQPALISSDKQDLYIRQRLLADGKDQYLLTKKHDPKQLLLPLTTTKESMDGTMTVAITSPSPSLTTDDDVDQFQKENHHDFSISTNDLPMQQPSPASSEYFSSNSKSSSSNENTPKQKKRRFSQRKTKKPTKVNEEALISPIDEPFSEQDLMTSATTAGQSSTSVTPVISNNSDESSSSANMVPATTLTSSEFSDTSAKRSSPDDGHDETPEEKRSRLLERNRIAAAKCRQKKKQAQESLQQQASDLTQRNTTMHSLVNDLREEALKLKNQLLAHSTCNCNVIQEYVRTSGQFAFARAPYTK